ncbi:coagulation factor V-like [Orbicella faveolata]|uniref:coagulation factor V-like n=1 Tax=Orbicella faveolata TaxID=48498 RepID=UPI0009E594BB|nr:coagulation factor V-like [Orbicella faveolata]
MQNGRIRLTQLSASSSWDANHGPRNGRLKFHRTGSRMGAWCARRNDRYQYYQVDFRRAMRVVKIATQGRQDAAQWVTQYFVTYSQDGCSFAEYKENSNRKYFTGNRDQNSIVQYRLFPPIRARYVRIRPWGWYRHISMRVEFYGCAEDPCYVPLGLEDKRITNGAFSASSYYNHHLAPWHGRLNHRWSWSVRHRNNRQWLQVNMQEIYRMKGIGSQGRQDANQWVKSYTLSYGMNGVDFAHYKENGRVKVRHGASNTDRHSVVFHRFRKRFAAVFVRVHPKAWYSWISMRIELFGCSAALCNSALGMKSGAIRNAQITASSIWNKYHAARLARMGTVKRGRYVGAWCARHNNHHQWLKVDFKQPMKITKIETQGRQDTNQWVTRYQLSYSQDGAHWTLYRQRSNDKYFQANRDQHSIVANVINPPIIARFCRIIPRGWYRHISMRVEFYGCKADKCDVPLGIQDGRITQSMMSASSFYNRYYGPWSARLQARNHGATRGGWLARVNNNHQFLQIDLGAKSVVKRISTQGRYDANQWVTSYTLSYSQNGVRFYPYRENRRTRVSEEHIILTELIFPANQERHYVVTHRLFKPFAARYVRVNVRTWYGHIAMRVELYGCILGKYKYLQS